VIIEHLSWHWLFLIGAVPVLAATALLALFVPESPVKTPTRPDCVGGAALSVALGSLLIAISEGSNWGWTSGGVLGLAALSVLMFYVWVRIERRVPEPLVDLQVAAAIISANTLAGTDIPLERAFTIAFTLSAIGAVAAFGRTFLLTRRPTGRPVPEPAR
jgi:hypothetical protein